MTRRSLPLKNSRIRGSDMNEQELHALIQPFHKAKYEIDMGFAHLEKWLDSMNRDWGRDGKPGLNLDPDFQRGHVWDDAQRVRYIEYLLRGGTAANTIHWNHAYWEFFPGHAAPDLPYELQIVDGKQRLEAVRRFMRGEVRAFGMLATDFAGTEFDVNRVFNFRLRMNIHSLTSRAELLKFYLALNSGGVVHTPEELDRVRGLLAEASAAVA